MNHVPRTESQELWPSGVSPYLLLGDVSGKAKATNFYRLSAIWNLVDFEFSIRPGISLARSLGLSTRSCLELRRNNHLRNSWHHWLACDRQTLGLHAEHAVRFMWSGIFINSASCMAQWTCDTVSISGKFAAFLHTSDSAAVSKSISRSIMFLQSVPVRAHSQCLRLQRSRCLRLQRRQRLRLQRWRSSARGGLKSRKEDRCQESRIRSKDERCRHMRCLQRQLSRHGESSLALRNAIRKRSANKIQRFKILKKVVGNNLPLLQLVYWLEVVYLRVVSGLSKRALESQSSQQREFLKTAWRPRNNTLAMGPNTDCKPPTMTTPSKVADGCSSRFIC